MSPRSGVAARGAERALADRRRRYEDEVERLLAATFTVMRDRDTANPSVADILATSGLSTSAFYRHFPTKDDLLVMLLQRAHEMTRRHIDERLAAQEDGAERVAEWVRSLFDLLRTDELVTTNRPFLVAHPRLLEEFPDEIGAGFDDLLAPLTAAIADARVDAGLAEGDPAGDARLVLHQVFGMLIDHAALRRTAPPDEVEAVVAYTRRAVLSP